MQWKRIKVGVLTFCLVLLLAFMFSKSGRFYEVFYLKFLFQFIRVIHDYTFGVLPVPSIYIVVPVFFYYFLRGTFRKGIKSVFNGLLLAVIWIINWFYILWGFNYAQGSGYELFDLERVKVDSTYIESEFLAQTDIINNTVATKDIFPFQSNEAEIRPLMEAFISKCGFPTLGRVRIRKIPGGGLLNFRTSGIYIPHAFEGHVDGGLFYLQYPFTIAHEMAHGYGFTDESVCNYIAYKVCRSSDNPWIRYSAELAYWRYLSGYFKYYYPGEWETLYESLDPKVKTYLEEMRRHVERYKDWMPEYRDKIYDAYLKKHGVHAGIRSYNQMILLIAADRAKDH